MLLVRALAGLVFLLAVIAGAVFGAAGTLRFGPGWGFLAVRLLDEERVLAAELAGYADYRERVKHRLVPGIW